MLNEGSGDDRWGIHLRHFPGNTQQVMTTKLGEPIKNPMMTFSTANYRGVIDPHDYSLVEELKIANALI